MILFMKQELSVNLETITRVEKVELESSREIPSSSLKVRIQTRNNEDAYDLKQGDSVIWKAGYKKKGDLLIELTEEFRGVITEITPSRPLEFIARDNMFFLSLKKMNKNLPALPIGAYAQRLLSESEVSAIVKVDPSVASKIVSENIVGHSARYALWKLRDPKYGCDVYFKGNFLYIENQYDKKEKEPDAMFAFNHTIISSSLAGRGFKSDFGKKKTSQASMIKRLGDDLLVEIVSEDTKTGLVRTAKHGKGTNKKIYYIDNLSANDISKKAKEIFEELTGEGFTGNFVTFGYPSVTANDVIHIEYPDNEQMSGNCIVEKVVKTYDAGNATYRQVIYPGKFTEPPKRTPSRIAPKPGANPVQGKEPTTETIVDKIYGKYNELKSKFNSIKIL